ncbi:MAG: hypothetical protein RLZZ46_1127 [Bacteroidota bacterium]
MTDRLSHLRLMAAENPGDPFFHYAQAMEYLAQGSVSEAILCLKSTIDIFPDYLPSFHLISRCLIEQDHLKSAEIYLHRGIELAAQQRNNKAHAEMRALLGEIDNF